jgi:hypothetical protein
MTQRDEVWELCSLLGDDETQADVEVPFGKKVIDEEDRYEPLVQAYLLLLRTGFISLMGRHFVAFR